METCAWATVRGLPSKDGSLRRSNLGMVKRKAQGVGSLSEAEALPPAQWKSGKAKLNTHANLRSLAAHEAQSSQDLAYQKRCHGFHQEKITRKRLN